MINLGKFAGQSKKTCQFWCQDRTDKIIAVAKKWEMLKCIKFKESREDLSHPNSIHGWDLTMIQMDVVSFLSI